MIKRFIILVMVCFILNLSLAAYAGTPDSIRFLRQHKDECVEVNRYFYANGDDGYVLMKSAPSSEEYMKTKIENNYECFIRYTYNYKGELWGYIYENPMPGNWFSSWISMNKLVLVYDSISFFEEHKDEFYSYTGSYDALKKVEKIIVWPWPGFGGDGVRVRARAVKAEEIENFSISYSYKDKDGREWGFISSHDLTPKYIDMWKSRFVGSLVYVYPNYNDMWICISDPANYHSMPAFNPPRVKDSDEKIHSVPDILLSGDNTFIADITEKNRSEWIGFSNSLKFREVKDVVEVITYGVPLPGPSSRIYTWRLDGVAGKVGILWSFLRSELSDAAAPKRFRIPYAFAFELTSEEHALCEAQPDEILNIIKGKKAILTWITPEIQWGDKLRSRYLREYIRILKEKGYIDWVETIEKLEGKIYLYNNDLDNIK